MANPNTSTNNEEEEEEEFNPFVSAAERKRRLLSRKRDRGGLIAKPQTPAPGAGAEEPSQHEKRPRYESDAFVYHPAYARRDVALLDIAEQLRDEAEKNPQVEIERAKAEEAQILETVTAAQTQALKSTLEHAKGIKYTRSLETGWRPVRKIRKMGHEKCEAIRKKLGIIINGEDVPPPIKSFKQMRLPKPIIKALEDKNIVRPTPIQIQGLPVALSGRDMIGIAFTGSGKTITFTIPMVLMALGEELREPLIGREGPFGLIFGPSRELQRQTFQVVESFCKALKRGGYPSLRSALVIGGEDKNKQLDVYKRKGIHMVVATPGRMNDFLKRKDMTLDFCRYFALDEADRMMDLGFDEEVQETLGYCKGQRQMLLFSATMPKKFLDFAQTSLVKPIIVNVGRAGAASLDVVQEVECIKQEARIVHLLQTLQKSPPPVLIFCERKNDVEDIVEYLLLKGVDAVSIHGGKSQQERNEAIDGFKRKEKDVLVATDIAAKGLDFPDIQHVINFDMPNEIEHYIHRIGRTGRAGKTGIATTFIDKSVDESVLLDLKHLLAEAKQRIPPFLLQLNDQNEGAGSIGASTDGPLGKGCSYCGGLGHRITNCPKLQSVVKTKKSQMRDVVGGATYGGDW